MINPPAKKPDSLAQGYVWATRISSIALQAVVPAVVGYWLDGRWGTFPWLLVVGSAVGLVILIRELLRITSVPPSGGTGSSA